MQVKRQPPPTSVLRGDDPTPLTSAQVRHEAEGRIQRSPRRWRHSQGEDGMAAQQRPVLRICHVLKNPLLKSQFPSCMPRSMNHEWRSPWG